MSKTAVRVSDATMAQVVTPFTEARQCAPEEAVEKLLRMGWSRFKALANYGGKPVKEPKVPKPPKSPKEPKAKVVKATKEAKPKKSKSVKSKKGGKKKAESPLAEAAGASEAPAPVASAAEQLESPESPLLRDDDNFDPPAEEGARNGVVDEFDPFDNFDSEAPN